MRADVFLTEKGHTKSREKAKKLIIESKVIIDGKTVSKPSDDVDIESEHTVEINDDGTFVGRGGIKLEAAINSFGIDIEGKTAIDIGASTGGFTECLLRHGASCVYAVDSGHGQLAQELLCNERVINIEGFNARYLSPETLGIGNKKFDIAVMDVSFISQTYIIPGISKVLDSGGYLISLIKPQFEAGKKAVCKNGIVKDANDRYMSVLRVLDSAKENGFGYCGLIRSPITGGDGNAEYLVMLAYGTEGAYPDNGFIKRITE